RLLYIRSWSSLWAGRVPFASKAASCAALSNPFSPGGRMLRKPPPSFAPYGCGVGPLPPTPGRGKGRGRGSCAQEDEQSASIRRHAAAVPANRRRTVGGHPNGRLQGVRRLARRG